MKQEEFMKVVINFEQARKRGREHLLEELAGTAPQRCEMEDAPSQAAEPLGSSLGVLRHSKLE